MAKLIMERFGKVNIETFLEFETESMEPSAEIRKRAESVLEHIIKTVQEEINEGATVLISTHGAYMLFMAQMIQNHCHCKLPTKFEDLPSEDSTLDNTAIFELIRNTEEGTFECTKLFCREHLL